MSRTIFATLALLTACDLDGLSETGTELEECSTDLIDSVDVSELSIEGDTLSLTASFGGGCEDHEFRLCWNGAVDLSDPAQISVALIHDGNGDSCEAYLSEELSFDLSSAELGPGDVLISIDEETILYVVE
ncbi:MAG: hypothetical protein ACI8S6_005940 [Myxococcota bacterium]|jgi:hypothetical protein